MIQSGSFFWVYVHTTGIVKTVNSSLFNNLKPEHGVRPFRGWDEQNSIKRSWEQLQTFEFWKRMDCAVWCKQRSARNLQLAGVTVSPQINLDLSHFPPATMHDVFICHHTNNLGCTHDQLPRLGRLRRFKSCEKKAIVSTDYHQSS